MISHKNPFRSTTPLALACLFTATLCFAEPGFAEPEQDDADAANATEIPAAHAADTPEGGVLPLEDLRMFAKVYNQIRAGYVEEISDAQLLEYAIKGMLSQLDPHSNYLDSSSFEDLQVNTLGEFGGLGIEVEMENGYVKVIAPIDDTPAARAGMQSGDLIIKLDNKDVKGMSRDEALDTMRGVKGSEIDLTIVREGGTAPIELTIIRDIIKVRSVRERVLEPGYGYVRIAQFQVNTGQDVASAVGKLRKEGELKGLILDLRNNPGGVLQAAVDVADLFLDDGLVVYTEGRIEDGNIRYNAKPGDLLSGLPLIVLVNEGSASASEILAGALQDHHRGIVLGTDSFGKGSVQTVMQISEDKAIKLTTALYFTPSGRSIQAQGIKPDIYVVPAQATARRPVLARPLEADLKNHLEVRKNGAETEPTNAGKDATNTADAASRSFEQFGQDNQLYEALNMLKGITVFGKANEFSPGRLLSRSSSGDHANTPLPLGDKPVINSPNISNEKQ